MVEEEANSRIPMENTRKIIRRSIYTFLKNYHYFTTTAALFALPYSVSILLSQASLPSSSSSSLLPTIYSRFKLLFNAAGFPPSSELFAILSLKLSQTISTSIFTLPFTLTFLLLAKSSIIQALNQQKSSSPPPFLSIVSIHPSLFATYLFNSFLLLSANASAFSLLFFAFNLFEGFGFSSPNCILFLSAAGAVVYSIILANSLVICNLALVLSGMERSGGFLALLKACVLIRGRTSTALSLALPINLAMAGIEALFQYRVVRPYFLNDRLKSSIALEGMLISYLYALFVVLDTIVTCKFIKSCKTVYSVDQEDGYHYRIKITEESRGSCMMLKNCEEIP